MGRVPILTVVSNPAPGLGRSCLFKTPASSPSNEGREVGFPPPPSAATPGLPAPLAPGRFRLPLSSRGDAARRVWTARGSVLSEPPQHPATLSAMASRVLQRVLFEHPLSPLPLVLLTLSRGVGGGHPHHSFSDDPWVCMSGPHFLNCRPLFPALSCGPSGQLLVPTPAGSLLCLDPPCVPPPPPEFPSGHQSVLPATSSRLRAVRLPRDPLRLAALLRGSRVLSSASSPPLPSLGCGRLSLSLLS